MHFEKQSFAFHLPKSKHTKKNLRQMMNSQSNNSMEKNTLTVNDCQDTFEYDLEWEGLAATVAEEIELEYFSKTSDGTSARNDQESEDIKIKI